MKIRKGQKYVVALNSVTKICYLTRKNSVFDFELSEATFGFSIFECTFSEAIQNLKIAVNRGYNIYQRKN